MESNPLHPSKALVFYSNHSMHFVMILITNPPMVAPSNHLVLYQHEIQHAHCMEHPFPILLSMCHQPSLDQSLGLQKNTKQSYRKTIPTTKNKHDEVAR